MVSFHLQSYELCDESTKLGSLRIGKARFPHRSAVNLQYSPFFRKEPSMLS